MKPHMKHIQHTVARKEANAKANNYLESYKKYKDLTNVCLNKGMKKQWVLEELEAEKDRIREDSRGGDRLYNEGIYNAKAACFRAIDLVIEELKEDD